MQLRWKVSFSASCLHAAASMYEGLPIADAEVAVQLQPYAEALIEELNACGLPAEVALSQFTCLAADHENNRQLAEIACRRMLGAGAVSEAVVLQLAGRLSDLEGAWLRHQPQLVDELAVRGRPLREQWEARGPGLLRAVTRLTEEVFVAPSAEVVLVSPVVGGHGRAHLLNNRVTFEAVLTNPVAELPEVVRLGWLLSQLNLDVPVLSESIASQRLPRLAGYATLPIILDAAEVVELAVLDVETIRQAMETWYLPGWNEDTCEKLLDWWQTMKAGNTRWPVALAALDQMLSA